MLMFICEAVKGVIVAALWVLASLVISHLTGTEPEMAVAITALVLAIEHKEAF